MIVKPKVQTPGTVVTDGLHKATLREVKQFTNAFGDRIGFVFRIDGGESDGVELMRSCGPQLTAKGKLADIIQGLIGRSLTQQELQNGFNLDGLKGTVCQVLVIQSKGNNGNLYSNIEKVIACA